ncbi:hypothetical protein C1645_877771 [Glomus cerebriforme]|uniref:Galactose oxidase n=1 Tax=Glomus cerebriforme TaxID=658196 RepID=A0A397SNS2_9GLOM|nr:hypothetical protein C1645_877771 [Glomus cerebriforme]
MFQYPIFLIFLSQLATIVNSYALLNRGDHTANYVNDKIYFLGGHTNERPFTNDFFYLDVSKPFNSFLDLPIVDLTNITYVPKHTRATSTICGLKKDTIFIFGGDIENFKDDTPLVFAFNTNNPEWSYANIGGVKPIRRRLSADICDKNAKMYIFGGTISNHWPPFIYSNDFDILDTMINPFIWKRGSDLNIPPPMDIATATLLPDGRIIYLGGFTPYEFISMTKIYLYDTIEGAWLIMNTNGISPTARGFHTSVLTTDGRIIVYGGLDPQPVPDIVLVLDTTIQPFRWSIPSFNFIPTSAPHTGHTATLVGNYMIVAFGVFYYGAEAILSNKIHLLDVGDKNDYKWVVDFTPNITIPKDTAPTHSGKITIIGLMIFSFFVFVFGFILQFIIWYYNEIIRDPAATPLIE